MKLVQDCEEHKHDFCYGCALAEEWLPSIGSVTNRLRRIVLDPEKQESTYEIYRELRNVLDEVWGSLGAFI